MHIYRVWRKRRRKNLQMYILGIETTGPVGSVAITDNNNKILVKKSQQEMNHLKDLMPMAAELCAEIGITPTEIDCIAVSAGPGSFTGIRIGVASARALAQALNIKTIGIGSLEAFRLKVKDESENRTYAAPIFNARRGQVYGALLGSDGDIAAPGPYMLTDIFDAVKTLPAGCKVVFYGDGIDAYESLIDEFALPNPETVIEKAPPETRYQSADMIVECAIAKWKKGELTEVQDLHPEYMRETEAEQKLKSGTLAKERAAKMARFMK